MAATILGLGCLASLLISGFALQVTPNSPCASLCLDDPSNPNVATTSGSDIVCTDTAYGNSAVGERFQSCINCLQNSSAVSPTENDVEWFLCKSTMSKYLGLAFRTFNANNRTPDNVRFAFDTCLFGMTNASESFSTPCSISTVCGPLATALEDSMTIPTVPDEFGYCTADSNSFTSNFQTACSSCLRDTGDTLYLSNCKTLYAIQGHLLIPQ